LSRRNTDSYWYISDSKGFICKKTHHLPWIICLLLQTLIKKRFYNNLAYSDIKSCGCQKREHDQILGELLTRVVGTSIDHLCSKKVPANSTTGVKGVYLIKGKHKAKIVFQHKQYWLGTYSTLEEAIAARREAEEAINLQMIAFYSKWKVMADNDPIWAEEHPIHIEVKKSSFGLQVIFLPEI